MSEPVNLDTPAGEAMIEAATSALWGHYLPDDAECRIEDTRDDARVAVRAALSATVECAVCGGDGKWKQWESSSPCYGCEGTGRRLAIKEMLDG